MTRVYVIRHAEAEGNLYRRIHGWYDSRVTPTGMKQLEILRERFKNVKLDAVYSSDLLRTRLTAEAVAYGSQVTVQPTERLREVNMGMWEDKTWGEILIDQKEQYIHFYSSPDKWHVDGSEAFEHLQDRLENAVIDFAAENEGKAIALVTHGCAIRSLIARIKNVAAENITQVPYCDNTGISVFDVEGKNIEIITHNDSAHLPDEYTRFRRQKWRNDKNGLDNTTLWFKSENEAAYTVMHESDPIGSLRLDPDKYADKGLGSVSYYLLDPESRGKKLSVQLLGQAVSAYRRLGRDKLIVELEGENLELAGYFEHYGFERIDPRTWVLDISLSQTI